MCVHQVIDIAFKIMDNKVRNVNGSNLRKKLGCASVAIIFSPVYCLQHVEYHSELHSAEHILVKFLANVDKMTM